MSARIFLARIILSLLTLVTLTALAPSRSIRIPPSIDVPVREADPSADLSLSGEAEDSLTDILLRLTVSNAGPDEAEALDLVVTSTDQALTFLEADAPGWTCAGTATGAACERPSLAAGESSEVALRLLSIEPPNVSFSPWILVQVHLSCATPDPTPNPPLNFWIFTSGANTIGYLPLVSAK